MKEANPTGGTNCAEGKSLKEWSAEEQQVSLVPKSYVCERFLSLQGVLTGVCGPNSVLVGDDQPDFSRSVDGDETRKSEPLKGEGLKEERSII